jgi:hypothetical protein
MDLHVVVDYSFLYYKYKFQVDYGKQKRLTQMMEWHGVNIEKDVSIIYYSMREIESIRRKFVKDGYKVIISVCFDAKSARKESSEEGDAASKYKSSRKKVLNTQDYEDIQFVMDTLSTAGYNVYRYDGLEADDLVTYLAQTYCEIFDRTIIYTSDADLLVNVRPGVEVNRHKSNSGYTLVNMDNFVEYCGLQFKCNMPYNAIMLYKCTVGDKSDEIKGIMKFGAKAFDKMVAFLDTKGINWSAVRSYDGTVQVVEFLYKSGYFTDVQYKECKESLELVNPAVFNPDGTVVVYGRVIVTGEIPNPTKISSMESRELAYGKYGMASLIS